MRYFGIFGPDFKKLFPYLKPALSNLSNCKISPKKMPKFGTKNALFGYFWARMPYLGILALEFLKKLLSFLKLAPGNLSNCLWIYKIFSVLCSTIRSFIRMLRFYNGFPPIY